MKDIKGYENLYQISEDGEKIIRLSRYVKNSRNNKRNKLLKTKLLTPNLDKYGYKCIKLVKNGIRKHHTIHRLVANTYLSNPLNLPSINHIDENKFNNHYSNLEWCTTRYNNLYNGRQTAINEKLKQINPNKKPVKQLDLKGNLINIYESIRDASRVTGVNRSTISSCCKGINKTGKGYIWKF